MIGYLKGKLLDRFGSNGGIITANGVGYEFSALPSFFENCPQGSIGELWIHTHVKEDALELYGFANLEEKDIFRELISVSGIGPKSAMVILSSASWDDIASWIRLGDSKSLTKLPKVGKKTAELLVLNLRDKFKLQESGGKGASKGMESNEQVSEGSTRPLYFVLKNLGFTNDEISPVLNQVDDKTDMQEQVRESLSLLRV